ncbi:unnamed protein product [Medioppia subpectinata]|uniref:MICOS complex subunit MIC60 n=1 Tax=Medioppia subpectinata TaxID=1979941 RepID=A0A7R9KFU8_9ACAR|nr:unnamed protein product [Medioppia subpectinata]CAG2102599.1 unnamed protein product [Medioppia subpectinata]
MFRSALKLNTISKLSKQNRNQCLRYYTTDGDKSSAAKVGLIVGSSVVGVTALTIGYAKYDPEFRRKVQNSVPFSDHLFNALLGPLIHKELSISSTNDSKTKDKIEISFLDKKRNRNTIQANEKESTINKSVNSSQNVDKSGDKPHDSGKTTDTKDSKTDNQKEDKKSETLFNTGNKEEKSDKTSELPDSSVSQLDTIIANEVMKDLLTLLPTDDQKLRKDIELEYQRKINKLEEKFELELKTQLKRQLTAFNEHLDEQMSQLRHQLKRNYDNKVEENVLEERNRLQSELSNGFYRLKFLEELLKAREQLDKDQHSVRELWVLGQALKEALSHKPTMSAETLPISLSQEMSAIESIVNKETLKDRPLIRCALESIPKEVITTGVYSEEDLAKRFQKVDKYCKRVALIGDEGGSLYLYLLSYVQSLLVFRDSRIPTEELEDKEVDPSNWDTFDILTRVKHCLKNHNLEMALKYANQLKGEPRNVAKDWIRDTRTHLEIKQAIDLLITEADAINVQIIN